MTAAIAAAVDQTSTMRSESFPNDHSTRGSIQLTVDESIGVPLTSSPNS